eukprot:3187392-Prymnesium_polylepis.3
MKEAGACEEDTKRLVKKGTTTSERWRMVEHLTDVRHAIVSTAGCLDYLCWVEERSSIPSPPGGSTTRWKYWLDEAEYLQPAHERYDHVLTFLLHTWLIDEGHEGILAGEEGEGKGGDDCEEDGQGEEGEEGEEGELKLSVTELTEKIELIQACLRHDSTHTALPTSDLL